MLIFSFRKELSGVWWVFVQSVWVIWGLQKWEQQLDPINGPVVGAVDSLSWDHFAYLEGKNSGN